MPLLYWYAFVQIIFESLPISSSAHVEILMHLVRRYGEGYAQCIVPPDFDFLLHIPTFLIVSCFLLWQIVPFIKEILFSYSHFLSQVKRIIWYTSIVDSITVLYYGFWHLVPVSFFPLWMGSLITTFLLWSLWFLDEKEQGNKTVNIRDGLIIGVVQGLAFLPGISRLGSTTVVGMWLGYTGNQSFLLSLLVHLPLMGVASIKAFYTMSMVSFYKELFTEGFFALILGASLLSFCVLIFAFDMIKKRVLWKLGWYTAVLTLVAFFLQ